MKRSLPVILFLLIALLAAALPTAMAQTASPASIVLNLKFPDGSALSNAPINVYQEPFQHGASYQLVQLATGTTDASGRFSFSVPYSDTEPEINALIAAVNSNRTWMVRWHEVMPTSGSATYTITANIDLSVSAPNASSTPARDLITFSNPQCERAADPDGGVDANAAELEADPDGPDDTYVRGTYQTLETCLQSGGGTSSALESGATGEEVAASSVYEDADGSLVHVDETKRWVRIVNHHSAPGMRSRFTMGTGRDTSTQVAVKVGDGRWSAGGYMTEISRRTASRTKVVEGRYHRRRAARYVFYKYQYICCSDSYIVITYEWKPHHWTGGLRRTNFALTQTPRKAANSIRLGVNDTFVKATSNNINYGAGVHLAGLDLNAETGYSSITKLSWTGIKAGCDKWLYGEHTDVVQARMVQATSNC